MPDVPESTVIRLTESFSKFCAHVSLTSICYSNYSSDSIHLYDQTSKNLAAQHTFAQYAPVQQAVKRRLLSGVAGPVIN